MPSALLGLILWGPAALRAEVEIRANTCANGSDDLGLRYINRGPDPLDMRGYALRVGDSALQGSFAQSAQGGYMVPPGSEASVLFQSCGGNTGEPKHFQLKAKAGACNEPDPIPAAAALTCADISPSGEYYNASRCFQDQVGVGNGDGYGGILDSWRGQTQIQVAIPSGTITLNGRAVRFDPASMGGPFYLLSMAALQEFLQVDMQVLLAFGAVASGAGLADSSGASLYVSPPNAGNDVSAYGSFKISYLTAVGRLYGDYPLYFSGTPGMDKLVSTNGSGPTLANSVQQVNSGFLAALNMWWLFDGLGAAQNLCFRQYLRDATDKAAGLKLLVGGYFIGPNTASQAGENTDYANHNLPASPGILAAADVTPYMKKYVWDAGGPDFATHNHITRIFSVLNQITASNALSAACGGSLPIYDAGITLTQVRELFFGQSGTPATQGNGGLLWHFTLPPSARQALWTDLDCAFSKLKGKAPGRAAEEVSFRYDMLTLLRIARGHLGAYLEKGRIKPLPKSTFSSEYAVWVHSHSNVPCNRVVQDVTFPSLFLRDGAMRKGDPVEAGATTDNRGISRREFTTDKDWRHWQSTDASFAVPATLASADRLWYRVVDSCGNAVIEEVSLDAGSVKAVSEGGLPGPRIRMDPSGNILHVEGSVVSIACFDALGVFAGWARPTPEPGAWRLPRAGSPLLLELRWRDGVRARRFAPASR